MREIKPADLGHTTWRDQSSSPTHYNVMVGGGVLKDTMVSFIPNLAGKIRSSSCIILVPKPPIIDGSKGVYLDGA